MCPQVANHIAERAAEDRPTNLAIFKYLIQKFRAIIDNKSSGHVELSLAIKGYGCFAAVSEGCVGGCVGGYCCSLRVSKLAAMQDLHEAGGCSLHVQ